jgi:hypothetical protein
LTQIKDSGNRTEFKTGAVRDMHEGKGRYDLIPWDATLPPAALENTDRTVVTPITKDSTGATLPAAQQKVDVYKIDLDHHIEFGGGGGVVNGKTIAVAAIQYNTKNVAYEIIGNKDSGIGLVKYRF